MAAENAIFGAAFGELLAWVTNVELACAAGHLRARRLSTEHVIVTAARVGALRFFKMFIDVNFPGHDGFLSCRGARRFG
jgi:hypothetical protein